jgi:hypothetical protein
MGSTSPPGDVIVPHYFGSLDFGTSGVSTLTHFQFSRTLIPRTDQTVAMCLPYRTAHINHGLQDFRGYRCKDQRLQFLWAFELWKNQTSTFFEMFLSEARDLLTCLTHGSTATISSSLQISEISNIKLHFSLKCVDFCRVSSWIKWL